MDLKQLSQIDVKDLQNIDWQKVLKELRKKPDLAIEVVMIVITLGLIFHQFNLYQSNTQQLRNNIRQLETKVETINKYKTVEEELNQYIANIPEKVTENSFINLITDLASKRNVEISSFSPSRPEDYPLYEQIKLSLQVTVKDYQDLWLFIHDLETSDYALRVDNWKGRWAASDQGGGRRRLRQSGVDTADDKWIQVEMQISALNLKNE